MSWLFTSDGHGCRGDLFSEITCVNVDMIKVGGGQF